MYATKEIIRLYASVKDLENTFVSSQIENVFVDDFKIIYPDGLTAYHQCKDVAQLGWGKDKSGHLLYDFKWQKTYSIDNGELFRLKIVYSHKDCDIHIKPIPEIIEDVTEKELFPAYPTLNAFLLVSEDIKDDIKAVLAKNSYDKLGNFAEIVRSIWLDFSMGNERVSLSEIKNLVVKNYGEIITFRDMPDAELPNVLKDIFDRFPDFSYTINGNSVLRTYRKLSGQYNLSDDLNSTIIQANPTEIFNLLTLL